MSTGFNPCDVTYNVWVNHTIVDLNANEVQLSMISWNQIVFEQKEKKN